MNKLTIYTTMGVVIVISGVFVSTNRVDARELAPTNETFITRVAQKLGVAQNEVVEVVEDLREDMQAQREAQRVESITQAIENGKLTDRQAQILDAMEDLKITGRPDDWNEWHEYTPEQREQLRDARREAMETQKREALYEQGLEVSQEEMDQLHEIMLEDGTEYHYTIILTDEEGYEYESFEDHVFSTPPRPQVSNVQIQEKKGVPTPTIEVFWNSNIAINSIVRYSSQAKTLDKVDMELIEGEHVMEINGLDPDSGYQLTVEGVDAMGNRATSDVYAFTTATDTRPPVVSGIKSEGDVQSSDIQSDRSRSAQLIISWDTDEPGTSQVLYGEGAGNDGYPYSTQTDGEMRTKHVIIVSNLTP
ncbi:MAG: hypothetical protein WCX94_02490, partial [Candidatus Dojkabacteria bacterium]